MGLVINTLVEDGIGVDDALTVQAVMNPLLSDALDLLAGFDAGGIPYYTLALDTERLAPSVHSMPAFNSFALIDEDVYAAGGAGIYRLGGDTDDGAAIHSGVAWLKTSFNSTNRKKIRAVFLEGEIENTRLQAETDTGSEVYAVNRHRISIGRNLIGRDWSLRLSDFDRLEAVELAFVIGRR